MLTILGDFCGYHSHDVEEVETTFTVGVMLDLRRRKPTSESPQARHIDQTNIMPPAWCLHQLDIISLVAVLFFFSRKMVRHAF